MSGFVRVRAASGPRHKFYAPVEWVAAHPELYVVIDKEPVSKPGPVEYVVRKPAPQVTEKSVGESEKEEG